MKFFALLASVSLSIILTKASPFAGPQVPDVADDFVTPGSAASQSGVPTSQASVNNVDAAAETGTSDNPTDTQILQLALALAQTEQALYKANVNKYVAADYTGSTSAYPATTPGYLKQVYSHVNKYVAELSKQLGSKNTLKPCTYKFTVASVDDFVNLANMLADYATSFHLGAARFIDTPLYRTLLGAILPTEARHSTYISGAVKGDTPWNGAFDSPLPFSQVYTLLQNFNMTCTSSNARLPFKKFKTLTVTPVTSGSTLAPNSDVTLGYDGPSDGVYMAFYNGLNVTYIGVTDKTATIPQEWLGTAYVAVTDSEKDTDSHIIAGPARIHYKFAPTDNN